jgi:hypothetical protein
MAEDVRKNFKGKDINEHIEKYASDKGLNDNEKQRLVEEVNVGTFLDKLREGTHHEDFPVADPIVTHSDGESPVLESSELNKAASYNPSYDIDSSMFDLSSSPVVSDGEIPSLNKVASISEDSSIMNSEEKWEKADIAREWIETDAEKGLEKLSRDNEIASALDNLTRNVNESEGMTKTAAVILAKNELDILAEDLIENSKYSTFDISSSIAEELSKEASDNIELLVKTAKNLLKDTGKALVGLKDVAMYQVKHPLPVIGVAGGAYYLNSDRMNRPDKERIDMSLRSFKNDKDY